MDPVLEAFLRSWSPDPWIIVPLVLTGLVYLRGWRQLHQRAPRHFGPPQLYAFLTGLTALFVALATPVDALSDLLLQVHMVQHLLLMMVAPPLLWLGSPLVPLLRGLPVEVRRYWVAPFFRLAAVRAVLHFLTHPVVAWLSFVIATNFWHVPDFYELALREPMWHYVEHVCFLVTALLFWWPIIQPYPSRPRFSRWLVLPYLFLADLQNTVLSALLTFSDRVIYPHYQAVPRLWNISPLDDQAVAGVLMWVPGSIAYLVPLFIIGQQLLYGRRAYHAPGPPMAKPLTERVALPLVSAGHRDTPPFDVLRLPLIGRFLSWRDSRAALQALMFLLALVVIADGLLGPRLAPMNLAGVLPWVHWRGFLVLGLLVAGNVFCMACPFLLPRTAARRWLPARRPWPRWLRSKWLAVALLVVFFWAYEAFSLWDSPWWTAWIVVGYFAAALVVDGFFRGAAFCKYVCPIGQFNFVQSLVSPLEVRVRDPGVCHRCVTKDCIRGRGDIPGCELHLFQPRKAGNLDCTFCLDCIHACPHDNVGILATIPTAELWRDPQRSGLGRLSRRADVAALALVLVFAAFANAAGMVAPVVEWQAGLAAQLGPGSLFWIVTASVAAALFVLPLVLAGGAASLGRWWSGDRGRWVEVATRFSYALVPLGCGMWLAHYSFHLLTSVGGVVPVVQRCAADLGTSLLGAPEWGCGCCVTAAPWLLRLELLFLDLGLVLSLYTGYRIALEREPRLPAALRALAPWAVLLVLLFMLGVWLVLQPMQMRGTLEMTG